ncbi:MAG: redoxin domain-containing protein [Myxococcales bacterium FL481]|nr:MAG: redoxin domain-containing protein [Myxococcales bacterium FL481]
MSQGIAIGSSAPDFTLSDQFGRPVSRSRFNGTRNVIIVFYPLDWTPT